MSDALAIIGALGGLMTGTVALLAYFRTARTLPQKVVEQLDHSITPTLKQILQALDTMNALSVGELSAAIESRRIKAKPEQTWTEAERLHLTQWEEAQRKRVAGTTERPAT